MLRYFVPLALLLTIPVAAQHFSVGVVGGIPATDLFQSAAATSGNFTVGPSLQFRLPLGFGFEADALYRSAAGGSQFRFPLLAQYRFGILPIVHPFAEAGVSFDRLTGITNAIAFRQTSHSGVVVGFGVEVKAPFVRLSPQFRYTRQGSEDLSGLSQVNQVEFLVGLHF